MLTVDRVRNDSTYDWTGYDPIRLTDGVFCYKGITADQDAGGLPDQIPARCLGELQKQRLPLGGHKFTVGVLVPFDLYSGSFKDKVPARRNQQTLGCNPLSHESYDKNKRTKKGCQEQNGRRFLGVAPGCVTRPAGPPANF